MIFLTEVDGVAKPNNVATFRWYKPKVGSFDGINLKTTSFNGTNPIFLQKSEKCKCKEENNMKINHARFLAKIHHHCTERNNIKIPAW